MFKIKEIVKTANEAIAEILKDKDVNLTEMSNSSMQQQQLFTAVNGTGCHKSETQSPKTPPWVRRTQESINGNRRDLSALAEIKRDKMKKQNMKRKRLLRKYNTLKEENLD